jgi:uncharacterized protein YjbI with pentapeptide repeats
MNNQLKNIIDQYKNGQLKVRNESFSTETILDRFLALSSFTNANFLDLNLTNVDFDSSFFDDCSFEKAERESLSKAWFESCHFSETNFNGFDFELLITTAVEDLNFSKFNKSIDVVSILR